MSTKVEVDELPDCDFCKHTKNTNGEGTVFKAQFDGATIGGPWAYMCPMHFARHGVGVGTGMGQQLVLKEDK